MIIPTLLIVLAQTSHHQGQGFDTGTWDNPPATPAQVAFEAARARDFAWIAAVDRHGVTNTKALGDGEARREPGLDGPGGRAYQIGGITVTIRIDSGLVMALWGGADHSMDRPGRPRVNGRVIFRTAPRLVSDEEATAILTRAFAATGRAYGIQPTRFDDGAGNNGEDIAVNFLVTYRGVPFDDTWSCLSEIDRETGQLDTLSIFQEPPTPPADVTPGVAADDAHLTALRAAVAAGAPVEDFPVPHAQLCIALLDPKPSSYGSYAFTPADRADAEAGRSRLVVDVRLRNARTGESYVALVDAHDGHLMQVKRQPPPSIFSAGSKTNTPSARFAPPAEVRPWRVSEGGSAWSTPVAATLAPAPADGFAPTRKLLLTDGKVAFPADYDPASGRIGIDGPDGKPQVYALGPALAAALKR